MTQGELFNMVTSKDGLLTNMLLSGDTQGVAQLVRSFASELAGRKAVTNGSSGDGREGKEGGVDHSEMKKANIQVCFVYSLSRLLSKSERFRLHAL